ncbi:MAG: hypothetical protein ACLFQP_00625 [Halothece sp.]
MVSIKVLILTVVNLVLLGLTTVLGWINQVPDHQSRNESEQYFGEYREEAYLIGQQEEEYFNQN